MFSKVRKLVCALLCVVALAGCTLTNSVGVIDSDYRGEVMARITNISQESHTIKAGERCVQLVIVPVPETEYIEEELNVTERGTNGFGSTGRGN